MESEHPISKQHTLSIWAIADAWLGWLSIGARIIYAALAGPFRGASGANAYHHHLIQAAVKALTQRFSPLQLQYLFPSYDQLYLKHCKRSSIEPNFVSNGRGLRGFWMGDPTTAKYVVIQFHGGGFAMDATQPYLDFYTGISDTLAKEGITTAWLNVTYTLAPHCTYPTQFCEAAEALRYVVEDLERSPRDVILIGDSAGASLCLAILSHISHPSGDVPRLELREPLKALVCLSPWVSFRHDWPSVEYNKYKDIDASEVTERWSRAYLDGRPSNYYIEATDAPGSWWEGAWVEQTLVLAGADEVLLDPIRAWVGTFKKSNPDTTLVVGQNECHVAPLIWPLFGDKRETQQGAALKSWLGERLRS
ncbi:Alpha/Beta hydrolase protein [Aspergillus heterothallicus]